MADYATTTLQHVARELPRRAIAWVMLVVVLNIGTVIYLRGCEIADHRREKPVFGSDMCVGGMSNCHVHHCSWEKHPPVASTTVWPRKFIPPLDWTADEWRETVWPWR